MWLDAQIMTPSAGVVVLILAIGDIHGFVDFKQKNNRMLLAHDDTGGGGVRSVENGS